jgi:colanic acid/amylovoran biosynthesis protein
VLITNCVALNGGDAAILYGVIDRVRAALGPDVRIVTVDDQPSEVRARHPDLETRPRLDTTLHRAPQVRGLRRIVGNAERARVLAGAWCMGRGWHGLTRLWLNSAQRSALQVFHDATAVVSTGGTYLVERYPIAGRLLELEAALAMGRPLVLFTQSLGPFDDPRNRRTMRKVVRGARLVLLRDDRSRRNLAALGARLDRVHVVADAAFALAARRGSRREDRLRVAISVRDWPYASGDAASANERYRDGIAHLVESLVEERGATVTFLSTCQGAPEYWADDSAIAASIAACVDPSLIGAVHVDRAFRTPQKLLETLGDFDLVVATRMHMAILSLVAGVPVFPIAYEPKTRELFDRLQLVEWVRDLEVLRAPSLAHDVGRFLDQLPTLAPGLWRSVDAERRSALAAAGLLREAIGTRPVAAGGSVWSSLSSRRRATRRFVRRTAEQARFLGWAVRCPICERRARRFAPYRDRDSAVCVHCHSLERHRALWLWLRARVPVDAKVLHVAPEEGIAHRLRSLPIEYVSTDLESPLAMRHDDVTALPDRDGTFDIVICNHVLEHIPDDRAAMREIHRVLVPGGFAVLQNPIAARPDTVEDPSVTSPDDRWRLFGQDDHVRVYGWDFIDRLRAAGFDDVQATEIERDFPPDKQERYGLHPSPTVIARR